ncbi:helix-turn-helix domain-containing protein [Flavobacterium tegetincola]|nr:helix-turn-helix domain-containing protein [Flavobacterium tegetincola]
MLSKTIGSKLLELRKQKNWSQEQTADYLSISRSVINVLKLAKAIRGLVI